MSVSGKWFINCWTYILGLQSAHPTLMEPFYRVELQSSSSKLELVYSVISRRDGEVQSDEVCDPVSLSYDSAATDPLHTIIGMARAWLSLTF